MQFDEKQQRMNADDWRRWVGLSFEFGGVIAVFLFFGYMIDKKLGTGPWFMLGGFFVAFIGMFYLIIKELFNKPRK